MRVFITGGAGFIGCNLAAGLLALGHDVVLYDNLSRSGALANCDWLKSLDRSPTIITGDIRDSEHLVRALATFPDVECVFHEAGQVAVTSSVSDPRADFDINANGTLNLLEALRSMPNPPGLVFASTNKVYGRLGGLPVVEQPNRYQYADLPFGVPEAQQLDFHSPYGCSKGSADQYVLDYSRIYGLRTTSFRQSCIYGPRQFGLEDQGWLAWFTIAAVLGRPITIFGDGKQVRDVLFIDDLVDVYISAMLHIDEISGHAFNIGGGPSNTLSLLELIARLEELCGRRLGPRFDEWRPGDQPVYVSDVRKAGANLGWEPQVSVEAGVSRLYSWALQNIDLLHQHFPGQ